MSVVLNQYCMNLTAQLILQLGTNPGHWSYHLFVNLYNPTPQDTPLNYIECTLPGYSPFNILPANWTGGIQPGPLAKYQYPQLTWVFDPYSTAQQTIFGYWVQDQTANVIFSELFPAPFPVPPQGGELPLIPTWTDEQCPAS
jgi:hypothetical protein